MHFSNIYSTSNAVMHADINFYYPRLCGILATTMWMHSNSELLGTLCEKRHDAVVVMDNKYFITLVSVHIAVIALVGCTFTCLRLMKIPHPLV